MVRKEEKEGIAFAVAVPLLAMGVLIDDITKPHQFINLSMDYNIVFFGGLGGAIAGVAAAFSYAHNGKTVSSRSVRIWRNRRTNSYARAITLLCSNTR